MTWGTTHLGISILLVRTFSTKSFKERMDSNRFYLLMAALGALFPDIDLLIGGHRTWSHSIFFPLIFLTVLYFLPEKIERISNWEEINFYLKLFGLFWITHLAFDTSFGPLAYFYPLDRRLYDVTGGIVMVLNTAIVKFGGIFIDVKPLDPEIGKNIFFINWSAEQRVAYFGSAKIKYTILDFMVHAVIFAYWLKIVLVPLIIDFANKHDLSRHVWIPKFPSIQVHVPRRNALQAFLLLLLALVSFIGGPAYGTSWEYSDSGSVSFVVLSDFLQFFGTVSFRFPSNANGTLVVVFPQSSINYSVLWGDINSTTRETIRNFTSTFTDMYSAKNISYPDLIASYRFKLNETVGGNWIETNVSTPIAFAVTIPPVATSNEYRTVSLGFGLWIWNISNYFIRSINVYATFTIPRNEEYMLGWIFFSLFLSVAMIVIGYSVYKNKKNV